MPFLRNAFAPKIGCRWFTKLGSRVWSGEWWSQQKLKRKRDPLYKLHLLTIRKKRRKVTRQSCFVWQNHCLALFSMIFQWKEVSYLAMISRSGSPRSRRLYSNHGINFGDVCTSKWRRTFHSCLFICSNIPLNTTITRESGVLIKVPKTHWKSHCKQRLSRWRESIHVTLLMEPVCPTVEIIWEQQWWKILPPQGCK